MASRKVDFALQVELVSTKLAEAIEQIEILRTAYFDSGFNSGGADELIDEDIQGHDITVAKIINIITLVENQTLFLDNFIPLQGDYRAFLGAIRKFK